MRTLIIIAAMFCGVAVAAGADVLDGLRFLDGKDRSLAAFRGQTVIVVSFCGHCPPVEKWLASDATSIHTWIEQQKLPVTLVLATPDLRPNELKGLDREGGYGMAHALYAYDPDNRESIGESNIFQCRLVAPDGQIEYLPFPGTAKQVQALVTTRNAGTFRIDPAGITRAAVKELWWAVERGRPQAIRTLAAAAKGATTPDGAEAAALMERVRVFFAARQDELTATPASLASIEALEGFVTEADGVDTAKAQARLKELRAAKSLKDELRARDIYQQCRRQLDSPKPAQQKSGKENLAALAAKLPATAYGARAASEAH